MVSSPTSSLIVIHVGVIGQGALEMNGPCLQVLRVEKKYPRRIFLQSPGDRLYVALLFLYRCPYCGSYPETEVRDSARLSAGGAKCWYDRR